MACKGEVIVIDDDPDLLDLISYAFTRSGYRVATASNGTEGVAKVRAGMTSIEEVVGNTAPDKL